MSRSRRGIAAFLFVGLLSSACETGEVDRGGVEDTGTVGEAGPAWHDSVAAAAVQDLNERYAQAVAAGDTAAMLDLFADDAVVLIHNDSPVVGRAALRRAYTGFFAAIPDAAMTLEADTVIVAGSGDLAYEIASYTVEGTAPGGILWEDRGRFLFTLRPIDGRWRITAAATASELPPPGQEQAGGGE